MKKTVIFLSFLFLTVSLFASDSFKMKVRIFTGNTTATIYNLHNKGIDDIIFGKTGCFIDAVIKNGDEATLTDMGMKYKVLVPNYTIKWEQMGMKGRYAFGPYYTYWEMEAELDSIHNEFPLLTSPKYSIGKSREGNNQWAMRISANPNTNSNLPSFLVVGVHHAREPISCNVTVDFAKYLCKHYNTVPAIHWLLNNRNIYIIPVENPDGYIWNSDSSSDGMWRKNKRDNDHNGIFDESSDGVDPNRNYTYNWGYDDNGSSPDSSSETYRGPSAGSEPITQNMMNFISANTNINIIMNYHSYSNLLLYPWCYTDTPTPDSSEFNFIVKNSVKYNGYTAGQPGDILYNTNGDAMDWAYGDAGRLPFTGEIGEAFYQPYPDTIANQEAINFPMLVFMAKASGPYVYPESIEINSVKGGGLAPGQSYSVLAFLRNAGVSGNATNVSLELQSNDPYITISNPTASYGTMTPIKIEQNTSDLRFYITNDCPPKHIIKVNFITYFNGTRIITPHNSTVGNADTLYFWDFESGTNGWDLDSPWALTTSSYHSTSHSLTDSPSGNYANNANVSATLDNLNLSGINNLTLSFYQKYAMEKGYDHCYVEIKKGNGQWENLGVFTGDQSSFEQTSYDIGDYDTSSVSIRFRLNSDSYVNEDGWYIDDVLISGFTEPSNEPPSSPIAVSPDNDSLNGKITLKCLNATDPENDSLRYKFFVYGNSLLTDTVFVSSYIPEGNDTTSVIVDNLNAHRNYYWRVFAFDGYTKGDFSSVNSFYTLTSGISRYYNPIPDIKVKYTRNGITLSSPNKVNYAISDISGREVRHGNFTCNKIITFHRNGIFFLKLHSRGKTLNKKIVIIN